MADLAYRAMCAELVRRWDAANGDHDLLDVADAMDRARALLAQPEPPELTDEEIANAARKALDSYRYSTELPYFLEEHASERKPIMLALRAAIAADRALCARPTPQPPADGEVGELVERLRCICFDVAPCEADAITRAADLLERLASPPCYVLDAGTGAIAVLEPAEHTVLVPVAQPVAVSERPWEREGWCDDEGRCWWTANKPVPLPPSWWMTSIPQSCTDGIMLPANALPAPTQ